MWRDRHAGPMVEQGMTPTLLGGRVPKNGGEAQAQMRVEQKRPAIQRQERLGGSGEFIEMGCHSVVSPSDWKSGERY